MDLETPLSQYLRATYDLPLPARFYNPKTLKPLVKVTLSQVESSPSSSPLVAVFERAEGHLSTSDIANAFILENAPANKKVNSATVVEALRAYGLELSTRFSVETKYQNYSLPFLESDRAISESTLRAEKNYERLLSDGIQNSNGKIADWPTSSLSRPEVLQSNMVFTRVSWNAHNVDISRIRDRDITVQPIGDYTRLTNEDAPDIFSLIPVSSDAARIPYLGYHTPNSNQYRVATTTTCAATPGVRACAIGPDKDEYTYKVILKSDLYSDLRGSSAFLSFMIRGIFALLDLSHSTLILNRVPSDQEQALTEALAELLPFLHVEGLTHRRITARIVSPVGGPIAYHLLFFDITLNQEDYVGFKEEGDPQLLRTTKSLYLSPIPIVINPLTDSFAEVRDIHIVMANRVAANTELLTLHGEDKSERPHELTRGTSYVEFTVYEVSDTSMLKFTMAYLARMVGHYHEVAVPEYGPLITDEFKLPISLASEEASTDTSYSRSSTHIRGIDLISHAYPEVFGHNYTRQCPHYPVVKQHLDPNDVEYRPAAGDTKGGKGEWLKYPPDGAIDFYFRCGVEDSSFPYPSVIVSKLRNRTKYPVVPCCARTNQFKTGTHTEVAYRLGAASASSISIADITSSGWGSLVYPPSFNERMLMASDKNLFRGRLGRIPEALLSIIRSHVLPTGKPPCEADGSDESQVLADSSDESDRRLVRLGLSEPNMIHAAFLAVDPAYQALSEAPLSERAAYLKNRISNNLPYPACLYQELTATQATSENLLYEDATQPLFSDWTSASHYRILEEILDINLYVIIRVYPPENAIEPHRYYFEIPVTRSGGPHMRRHDSRRPSVILYRVRKFEGDVPVDSGVELLLHGTRTSELSGVWGNACTSRISELYTSAVQVLSFGVSPIKPESYVACTGLNTADYAMTMSSRGCVPVEQLIDERGLCRALTLEIDKERLKFSIVFPGTQPYNLPFTNQLHGVEYDPTARRIFGDACTISMTGDGVFYILGDDPTRWLFVPLAERVDMTTTNYTPLTGLLPTASDFSVRLRTAYTYLRVILFMVSFLYAFAEPRDPKNFMRRYIVLDELRHAERASEIYDFSGLKRILVLKELNIREALATIKRLAPSLLDKKGERIVLTSQKIYDSIAYYVRTVHDQTAALSLTELHRRRWDLASVITPLREGGGSAVQLLSPRSNIAETPTLSFGSARAVRTWFRGIHTGATSGSLIPSSDSRAVMDIVKTSTGVILYRHPKTQRVWLIPAVTEYLIDAVVICYLWITQHRVAELDTRQATEAALSRLAVQSGARPAGKSRITAIFRPKTVVSAKRTRSKGRLVVGDDDELDKLRKVVESANIVVQRYVITRDNRIELLAGQEKPGEGTIAVEVLRTGPQRWTPMLSP